MPLLSLFPPQLPEETPTELECVRCDQAKYVDPKSTLRYHNPEIYEVVKGFQPAVIQAYLAVRGQGVVLR